MKVANRLWYLLPLVVTLVWAFSSAQGASESRKKGKKSPPPAEVVPETPPEPVWPSPLDPGKLDPVFLEFPFGGPLAEVLTLLERRIMEQLRPLLQATADPSDRDRLKKHVEERFAAVPQSLEHFHGQETGYAVSMIAGEFQNGTGESLVKYHYSNSVAYFFFMEDRFWKLFLCLDEEGGFPALMEDLTRLYGEPQLTHTAPKNQKIREATWQDSTFELSVMAPGGLFVCSRVIWEFLPEARRVEARRQEVEANQGGSKGAASLLESVTTDTPPPQPPEKPKPTKKPKKKR
jgi:hypothetical protein